MKGIDLNQPITYRYSSMRFFDENEHHITRLCREDVLLLVFDGILRFEEDGISYEVYPGEYHIQKCNSFQRGPIASDRPKYLYVHFHGQWTDTDVASFHHTESADAGESSSSCAVREGVGVLSMPQRQRTDEAFLLPCRGEFDPTALMPFIEDIDRIAHCGYTYTEKAAKFYEILSLLYRGGQKITTANQIAEFIAGEYLNGITLEKLSQQFHFSKNHIINLFKKEYGITPFEYIHALKIQKAERLLMVTSNSAESIARECGFHDYAYFYKVFYKKNKLSPVEWRKLKRAVYN